MKIAIGGTFSPLHAGHTYLLKKAFYFGKKVVIGLTSDSMITKEVKSYEERKKELIEELNVEIEDDHQMDALAAAKKLAEVNGVQAIFKYQKNGTKWILNNYLESHPDIMKKVKEENEGFPSKIF